MTSVGETLRRERLRRNLELEQIAHELRISRRFLEAIEEERFDRLPGPVFAKSFVRQYARVLGLDEQELAAQVQRATDAAAPETPARPEPKEVLEGIHVPRMEQWQDVGEHRFHWGSTLPALAGVVVVMLVCSAVYGWWQRQRTAAATQVATRPPAVAVNPPQVSQTAVPGSSEKAPPETAQVPAPKAEPHPESPAAGGEAAGTQAESLTPRATAGQQNSVKVQLTADEPVWVLARADGKYLFSGTLDEKETRTVEADNSVLLRFGNAGGVNVSLNGKDLGALGPKGQVRTVQFTSGGFHIVPAPKVPAPDEPR